MKGKQALLLLVTVFMCACTSRPKSQPAGAEPSTTLHLDASVRQDLGITIVKAEVLPVGSAVTATGQLQTNEDASWVVGAITDGKVTAVPVLVGDHVRQGQPLAVLHSHDVHDARATLRQASSELARQKVLAEQARTVRDRTQRLFDLRAASREQLEAAEAMFQSAAASVATAQAELDKATFHLTDFLEVPAEDHAGDRHDSVRDELTIKSPASGTVMERRATAGSVVSAGDPVFVIADLSSLWLIASVNEADMSRVRPGQQVAITVRAFSDRKFTGRVLRLGERLDAQTRTLQVRVLVPNNGGLLKPDMFAVAEFATGEMRRVVQIPEAAVQEVNGKHVVFVSREDRGFDPREITTGSKSGGRVEVLSGLQAGDAVVAHGSYLLKTRLLKEPGHQDHVATDR